MYHSPPKWLFETLANITTIIEMRKKSRKIAWKNNDYEGHINLEGNPTLYNQKIAIVIKLIISKEPKLQWWAAYPIKESLDEQNKRRKHLINETVDKWGTGQTSFGKFRGKLYCDETYSHDWIEKHAKIRPTLDAGCQRCRLIWQVRQSHQTNDDKKNKGMIVIIHMTITLQTLG